MTAHQIHILTFGYFGPANSRRRLWVPPGRGLAVTQWDWLMVYIDRLNGHEQVAFELHGSSRLYGPRTGVLSLTCLELNFDVVARAIDYRAGRAERVLVELINLSLAMRAG